jgi:cation diffusion facilitator family transporter
MTAGVRITVISLVANLLLGAAKGGAGFALGSRALVADGLHSLLDLLTDVAVLAGLLVAARPEDENHPYGHHKFASLAKLLIGGSLVLFSLVLVVSSVLDLERGPVALPAGQALLVALVSLAVKEALFWWTRAVGRRLKSDLILANAWHHRTDSVSSLAVAAALLGVWLGGPQWAFLDQAVTLVLGSFLIFEAVRILRRACGDLLDAAPERAIIEDLREHILPIPGTVAYHDFRARRVGDVFEVDLHLQVDPDLTVKSGHAVAKEVKAAIRRKHPEVRQVLVHIEPADAEHLGARGISDGGGEPGGTKL